MTTETRPLEGTFTQDGARSGFGFSVVYFFQGSKTFRGSLDDVEATLTAGPDGLFLGGTAQVESISIQEPVELRAHVLSDDFFDADNHPEVTFRSTSVELREDGAARVEGELTIAGMTREVSGTGTWSGPDAVGRVVIELATSIDRRDFGFEWQMDVPGGGLALAWQVDLDIHVELVRQED
jgi:polyisoprenoid-binding protein YceI